MNNSSILNNLSRPRDHKMALVFAIIVINVISSILASVLNFLIILTFVKTTSLRTPSNILVLSLAISDFGIGVLMQPAYCWSLFAMFTNNASLLATSSKIFEVSFNLLIHGSFLTITAITIDRFLAIHLPLMYQEIGDLH